MNQNIWQDRVLLLQVAQMPDCDRLLSYIQKYWNDLRQKADFIDKEQNMYPDKEIIESIRFILFPNMLKNFLARFKLLDPFLSYTFNLSTKPILFKPKH
jgi:hypothetical protein